MRVRDAYYIYPWKPINFAIAVYTRILNIFRVKKSTPWISHIEKGVFVSGYIKDKKLYLYPDQTKNKQWFYFSSTMQNGCEGTRWIEASLLFKHRERWEVREEELSEKEVEAIIINANSIIPSGYDIPGLLGFASLLKGKMINSFQRWYCSETFFWLTYNVWEKTVSPLACYLLRVDETTRVPYNNF